MTDDSEYMTIDEFAELPSHAHHAVWKAYAERRVDVIPVSPRTTSTIFRYHRAQVLEIACAAQASRG